MARLGGVLMIRCLSLMFNLKIMIKVKFIRRKAMYSAYVTFNGYDYSEYGETPDNAVHFLKVRHPELCNIPVKTN